MEDYEQIRRLFYVEGRSLRQIAKQTGHAARTVKKVLKTAQPLGYRMIKDRAMPKLGLYKTKLDELLEANPKLPRKQRYTTRGMYRQLCALGYIGSQAAVQTYAWKWKKANTHPEVFLPLEYDPGMNAECDWGVAQVLLDGELTTAHLFVMRLSYSRRIFVCAYACEKQECFFEGHARAYIFFGGVPHHVRYDNLKTAVQKMLRGHNRVQQQGFVALRSHYLFEAEFCTARQGHVPGSLSSCMERETGSREERRC